jgi:hypothetical protein
LITKSASQRRPLPRLHHDLAGKSARAEQGMGRVAPMTAQYREMTDEEYEARLRTLVRIVSSCTLGLCSFAVGLLIGAFVLF